MVICGIWVKPRAAAALEMAGPEKALRKAGVTFLSNDPMGGGVRFTKTCGGPSRASASVTAVTDSGCRQRSRPRDSGKSNDRLVNLYTGVCVIDGSSASYRSRHRSSPEAQTRCGLVLSSYSQYICRTRFSTIAPACRRYRMFCPSHRIRSEPGSICIPAAEKQRSAQDGGQRGCPNQVADPNRRRRGLDPRLTYRLQK